jgi:hypothetical protein
MAASTWGEKLVRRVDSVWRKGDWRWSRLYWRESGQTQTWLSRLWGISGHPSWLMIFPAILIIGVTVGPTWEFEQPVRLKAGLVSAVILWLGLAVLDSMRKQWNERFGFWVQAAALLAASLFVVWWADPHDREAHDGLYHHILLLFVPITLACTVIAALLAWLLVRDCCGSLAPALTEVPLFQKRRSNHLSGQSWFHAFLVVPFVQPLPLLFTGAVFVLTPEQVAVPFLDLHVPLAPGWFKERFTIWGFPVPWGFLFGVGLAWLTLGVGGKSQRIDEMLETIGRLLFVGPQVVVTVAVTVLGLARVLNVSYVTYLLDAEEGVVNWSIVAYFTTAYVLCWFYAYWTEHFMGVRLLDLFRNDHTESGHPARVLYLGPVDSRIVAGERYLQLHGAGRLVVCGRGLDPKHQVVDAFQFYTPDSLLKHLERTLANELDQDPVPHQPRVAHAGEERPDVGIQHPVDPPPVDPDHQRVLHHRALDDLVRVAALMRQRLRFYTVAVNALFFAAIAGVLVLQYKLLPEHAQMTVVQAPEGDSEAAEVFDLGERLIGAGPGSCQKPLRPEQPRILLAASGGGTRAAMYTASLLRGLGQHGHLCDLVLASGVSGGSAALAYLALHQDKLLLEQASDDEWKDMAAILTEPFILDVVDGLSELRFVLGEEHEAYPGATPVWMRIRNGHLLEESFQRRFGGAGLVGSARFGLIFNSSLGGAFPRGGWNGKEPTWIDAEGVYVGERQICSGPWEVCLSECGTDLPSRDDNCSVLNSDEPAGGRIVLTNLAADAFGAEALNQDEPRDLSFVKISSPTISLAKAASLSANFPPVFSSSAIDVYDDYVADGKYDTRYWVTDGGAVENRGTVTLLLALRAAVEKLSLEQRKSLRLHVIVADASAVGGIYSQDRGVGSALGAGAQLGRALERELVRQIKVSLGDSGGQIWFHDLPMPNVLRTAGVGTHWMLPASVTFRRPISVPRPTCHQDNPTCEPDQVEIDRDLLTDFVATVHFDRPPPSNELEEIKVLRRWIQEDKDNNHPDAWKYIRACLDGDETVCPQQDHKAPGA